MTTSTRTGVKFGDVPIRGWFTFTDEPNAPSYQKTSIFGFTDPANMVLGEQQMIFLETTIYIVKEQA